MKKRKNIEPNEESLLKKQPGFKLDDIITLVLESKWQEFRRLINNNEITIQILSKPLDIDSDTKQVNLCFWLAHLKQDEILQLLLSKDLITSEMLSHYSTEGSFKGINTIWLLANNSAVKLLKKLIKKDLITIEQLSATSVKGEDEGKNAVWLLANNNHQDILTLLINKNLITIELLSSAPAEGEDEELNAVWVMAYENHLDILDLLIDKKLITTELLSAAPVEGENKGLNAVSLLANFGSWYLIDKLINQKRISLKTLSLSTEYKSVLFFIENENEWKILSQVLLQCKQASELISFINFILPFLPKSEDSNYNELLVIISMMIKLYGIDKKISQPQLAKLENEINYLHGILFFLYDYSIIQSHTTVSILPNHTKKEIVRQIYPTLIEDGYDLLTEYSLKIMHNNSEVADYATRIINIGLIKNTSNGATFFANKEVIPNVANNITKALIHVMNTRKQHLLPRKNQVDLCNFFIAKSAKIEKDLSVDHFKELMHEYFDKLNLKVNSNPNSNH